MDKYRELAERLRETTWRQGVTLAQGIVRTVEGRTCEVEMGSLTVPGVRLRASETEDGGEMLVVPKVGTAVIVGSLTGDLGQLVVLAVDRVESVTFNGGKLGGLVNIGQLTEKLNALVDAFNTHTHQVTVSHPGGTFATMKPSQQGKKFERGDYEDETVKH